MSVPKTRNSIAWQYFDKLDDFKAVCKLCREYLSYRTSVSNLMKHVRRVHRDAMPPTNEITVTEVHGMLHIYKY